MVVVGGPKEKVSRIAGAGGGRQPLFGVGLAALSQGLASRIEPGQELCRGFDAVAGMGGAGARPGVGFGSAAEPQHHLPGGVCLYEPAVPGCLDRAEEILQPSLGAGQQAVSLGLRLGSVVPRCSGGRLQEEICKVNQISE